MQLRYLGAGTLLACTVSLAAACGGNDLVINDDGVSSGGVEIEAIEPARGPLPGGQDIVIRGTGFTQSGTEVVIGDRLSETVLVRSTSEIEVRTPPGVDPATVDVIVFTKGGFASRTGGYSYNPLPTVTAVTADRGPAAGGNTVTITGTGFQDLEAGANVVEFGPYSASDVTVVGDTELSVVAPSSAFEFEDVDVTVTNDNGSASLARGYRFQSPGFIAARASRRILDAGQLYFVSATTGSFRLIGETRTAEGEGIFISGLTFDGDTLYAVSRHKAALYTVDPATGLATEIGDFGAGASHIQGLTVRGGVLYGFRRSPARTLVTIDKATGLVTEFTVSNLGGNGGGLVTNDTQTTTFFTGEARVDVVDITTGTATGTPVQFGASRLKGLAFVGDDLYSLETSNLPPPDAGGGGGQSSVLVKLDLVQATKQTIGLTPRLCALATLPL